MAASSPWFGWLSRLASGLWSASAAPGSHEAALEADRVGALLNKELRKPEGQRDEELVHALSVDYRKRELENLQVLAAKYTCRAESFEEPIASQCCAAAGWVWRRIAASYRAQNDFYCQKIEQVKEELAAAKERRPAVIVAEPALRLHLPAALQQRPPRLDMCSKCAEWLQTVELAEQGYQVHEKHLRDSNRSRGLQPAPAGGAASREAAGCAAAAAVLPAGESQPCQQRVQRQEQVQQQCCGGSGGCGAEREPGTPTQPPSQQQQQQQQQQPHSCSKQEQEQRQE